MQATVRTTWFGIDRIKLALVAAGILASTIVGAAAITLIDDEGTAVPPRTTAVTMQHRYAETSQYATVRDEWAGTASLEANGLPVAPAIVTSRSANTAELEANGLPITPALASDNAIWHAFPGHAGFTTSEGDGTATLTRTYYPGHPGFINP